MKSVPATLFFRPMKEPPAGTTIEWVDNIIVGANAPNQSGFAIVRNGVVESEAIKSPFSPGEVCWVRERWAETCDEYGSPIIVYKADNAAYYIGSSQDDGDHLLGPCETEWSLDSYPACGKWRSPVTMPAWAARRFVTILSCEPMRVEEVTEEDAIKMGAYWWHPVDDFIEHWRKRHPGTWAWRVESEEEK